MKLAAAGFYYLILGDYKDNIEIRLLWRVDLQTTLLKS